MKRLHTCVYCGGADPPITCGHWLEDDPPALWRSIWRLVLRTVR